MKSYEELEKEYAEFQIKATKAGKDLHDAVNELSPENQQRFKRDVLSILPAGLISFINSLKN